MKEPLVILTGPTAVGKTALSVKLAQRTGGEIISADSMQVYRGLDIGSAKITEDEMCGVRHHLIDCLDFFEEFNVYRFKELALEALSDIRSRGRLPIIAGGTGFYIQALLYDIDFSDEDNSKIRAELEERAAKEGPDVLYRELINIDKEAADSIHPNNVKRVIRALEYYHLNGRRLSDHNEEQRSKESPYNFAYFVLDDDRSLLYDRINRRVDLMLEAGLFDEVKDLYERGLRPGMTAAEGIGYKQLLQHFNGEITYDEAVYEIKLDSRHYAKRQLTWFRRERDTVFLNRSSFDGSDDMILERMLEILREKEIFAD